MARIAGGSRKVGRAKKKCELYRTRGIKERNRDRRMEKRLLNLQKHHPDRKYKIATTMTLPDKRKPEQEITIIRRIK